MAKVVKLLKKDLTTKLSDAEFYQAVDSLYELGLILQTVTLNDSVYITIADAADAGLFETQADL